MPDADNDTTNAISHREAIAIAKKHVSDVFRDEEISPPTLEEIWFDDVNGDWFVTVGFQYKDGGKRRITRDRRFLPEYRTVRINGRDGRPISIELHESAA